MKKYTSPEGWKVVPACHYMPELFISPEGITYKRTYKRESIDVSVQTKYGLVELHEWFGCTQERRTSRHSNRIKKFNKKKRSSRIKK